MNVYDCCSIDNTGDACPIAGNLICDERRTATHRRRQYLKLLKVKGQPRAITLHRNVVDFRVESA